MINAQNVFDQPVKEKIALRIFDNISKIVRI